MSNQNLFKLFLQYYLEQINGKVQTLSNRIKSNKINLTFLFQQSKFKQQNIQQSKSNYNQDLLIKIWKGLDIINSFTMLNFYEYCSIYVLIQGSNISFKTHYKFQMENLCSQHLQEIVKICMNENCKALSPLLCQQCDYSLLHQNDPNFNYADHVQTISDVECQFQELKKSTDDQLSLTQIYLECAYYIYYKFVEKKYNLTKEKLIAIKQELMKVYQLKQNLNAITLKNYMIAAEQNPELRVRKYIDQISIHALECEKLKATLMNNILILKIEEQNISTNKYAITILEEEYRKIFQDVLFRLHSSKFFHPYKIDKNSIEVSILFYFIHYSGIIQNNYQDLDLLKHMKHLILRQETGFIAAYLHFQLTEIDQSQIIIYKNEESYDKATNKEYDHDVNQYQQYNGLLYLKGDVFFILALLQNYTELDKKLSLIDYAICQDSQCFYLIAEKIQLLIKLKKFQPCIKFIASIKEKVYIQDINYYFGISYLGIDDFQEAIIYLKKSIYLNKKHIDSFISLAQVYVKMKIYDLARNAVVELIEVDPKCHLAYQALYDIELEFGKKEKAYKVQDLIQSLIEKKASSYVFQAQILANQKNYQGALQRLAEIKEENNYDAIFLEGFNFFQLVYILLMIDEIMNIKKLIEKLKQLDPYRSFQDLYNKGIIFQQSEPQQALSLFQLMKVVYKDQAVYLQEQIIYTQNIMDLHNNQV
ncbi:hypothetical protein pb186bvf_002124 [Paramecium bursaria]